jgi:hypothetical protein
VLLPYVEPALARLRYLYPDIEFAAAGNDIEVLSAKGEPAAMVEREIRYALYREKIYAETLPLRRALIKAVTSK